MIPTGYLYTEEEQALRELSAGVSVCVDLGTCHGKSAMVMAEGAASVITIDLFEQFELIKNVGSRDHYRKLYTESPHSYADVKATLSEYKNIEVRQGIAHQLASGVPDKFVDLLFIDADHSYAGIKADFEAWFQKVRMGGIIALHDVYSDCWDVGAYVDNEVIRRDDLVLVSTVRTMAIFQRVA